MLQIQMFAKWRGVIGDKMIEELKQLAQSYIVRADRLFNLRSTLANKCSNNSVASVALKNRYL